MITNLRFLIFGMFLLQSLHGFSQQDSVYHQQVTINNPPQVAADTLFKKKEKIAPAILILPDSLMLLTLKEEFSKGYAFPLFEANKLLTKYGNEVSTDRQEGSLVARNPSWLPLITILFLILFAVYKYTFPKRLTLIVQAFYNNRSLNTLGKEEENINTWPRLTLFISQSLVIGLFLYLALHNSNKDFYSYLYFTVLITSILLIKVVLTQLLSLVLDIESAIKQYLNILYITYINLSFFYLPIIVFIVFGSNTPIRLFLTAGIYLLLAAFFIQMGRAFIRVITQYKFSNLYLFLYFCSLEICPLLILIKATGLIAN